MLPASSAPRLISMAGRPVALQRRRWAMTHMADLTLTASRWQELRLKSRRVGLGEGADVGELGNEQIGQFTGNRPIAVALELADGIARRGAQEPVEGAGTIAQSGQAFLNACHLLVRG